MLTEVDKKNKMRAKVKKPLVSVIIPCFNYAHFLPEALESILNQTYKNWECIVVNDGSTDDTRKVTQSYTKKDERFKYFYQSNKGVSVARNRGIKKCRGKYIQLLDADDFIAPEKIKNQLKCFNANPSIDIVYSEYQCFNNEDRSKTWIYSRVHLEKDSLKDFAKYWEKGLSIPIHCFLYKKTCFDKWGLFDESFLPSQEDWDSHLIFAAAGAKYMFLSGVTAFYRVTDCSRAGDPCKMRMGRKMLFRKHIFKNDVPRSIRLILLKRYFEHTRIYCIVRSLFHRFLRKA